MSPLTRSRACPCVDIFCYVKNITKETLINVSFFKSYESKTFVSKDDFNRLIQSPECDQTLREIINQYLTEHSSRSPRAIILEILVGSQKNGFTFK